MTSARTREVWDVDWELVGTKRETTRVRAWCWQHARNIVVKAARMTFSSREPIIIHGGKQA